MAVVAADFLIVGGGRLNPTWFQGSDAEDLLAAWIERSEPGSDELVTARVYVLAFTFLADQVHAMPSTQRDRNKTASWSAGQLEYWQAQARRYQSEVDAFTGAGSPQLSGWEGDKEHGRLR